MMKRTLILATASMLLLVGCGSSDTGEQEKLPASSPTTENKEPAPTSVSMSVVPDLKGLGSSEAESALFGAQLEIVREPRKLSVNTLSSSEWRVIEQSIPAGEQVEPWSKVVVLFGLADGNTEDPNNAAKQIRWGYTFHEGSTPYFTMEKVLERLDLEQATPSAVYFGSEPFTPTADELKVIEVAAGDLDNGETQENLYKFPLEACVQVGTEPLRIEWAKAARILCPDAPHLQKLFEEIDGTRFSDGNYLVGEDIQAGKFRSQKNTNDCYWERTTSGGDTIRNDFVTFAAKGVTVTLRKGEGFTSSNCGEWTRTGD